MTYIHPNLYQPDRVMPILDLEKQELVRPGPLGVGFESHITDNIEAYLAELKAMNRVREALHIPPYSYCAASFRRRQFDVPKLIKVIEWCVSHFETRFWTNPVSGLVLICTAEPDLSEDAGYEYYERARLVQPGYEAFHAPAWWEFCQHGVRIPPDWKLDAGPEVVRATSPDGRYGMVIGGISI